MFFRTTLIAAAIAMAAIGLPSPANAQSCPEDYYRAASGDCVHRPVCWVTSRAEARAAAGEDPTALCNDGCYSFSEEPYADETCSAHDGVYQVFTS
jgi:Protein of unknown function (DUF3761)